jgi:hypothetical protein
MCTWAVCWLISKKNHIDTSWIAVAMIADFFIVTAAKG